MIPLSCRSNLAGRYLDSKRAAVVFIISIVSGTLSNHDITSLYGGRKLTPFSVLEVDLSAILDGFRQLFLILLGKPFQTGNTKSNLNIYPARPKKYIRRIFIMP
jgi:hypothetical protein